MIEVGKFQKKTHHRAEEVFYLIYGDSFSVIFHAERNINSQRSWEISFLALSGHVTPSEVFEIFRQYKYGIEIFGENKNLLSLSDLWDIKHYLQMFVYYLQIEYLAEECVFYPIDTARFLATLRLLGMKKKNIKKEGKSYINKKFCGMTVSAWADDEVVFLNDK